MNGKDLVTIDICDYKKSILEIFESLTETDIQAALDVMKADHESEKSTLMGMSYIMAVNRCRNILEIILQDKQQ